MEAIDQNLVKALGHPIRVRILEALQGRSASPVALSKALEESLGVVSYHTNALVDCGCIEQTRTRPRRGTIEHFFTAIPRSFIGAQDWRRAPLSIRGGITEAALRTFLERAGAALDAGTIDAREDTMFSWLPMQVDERGWGEMTEVLDAALRALQKVHARSRERLGGKDGIPVVAAVAGFETADGGAITEQGPRRD
jgi:DNA-binding transcriptional ArsR family regulator